jgi:anti-anti-sigma factor
MAGGETIDVPVVRAPREVLGGAVPDLTVAAAPHVLGEGPGLVIDLSTTEFLSSSGLSELVRLGMDLRDRGAVLVLAAPSRAVDRMIRVVGLDRVIPVFATILEAADHVRRPAVRSQTPFRRSP